MNVELKRKSRVVQVFSDTDSLIRLVGAVYCNQNDAWAVGKSILLKEDMFEKSPKPTTKEKKGVLKVIEGMFDQRRRAA